MNAICGDIGHCETIAEKFENNANADRISSLKVYDNEQKVNTILQMTEDQIRFLSSLGDAPAYPELKQMEKVYGEIGYGKPVADGFDETFLYFKRPPAAFGEVYRSELAQKYGLTCGQLMACFAYKLIESVFRHNVGLNNDTKSQWAFYVGCPTTSAWTAPDALEKYQNLLSRATWIGNVVVIPESRAAVFSSVRQNRATAISAAGGVLVFDFGSSTADWTYMLVGRTMLEGSWTLGASLIEMNIVSDAIADIMKDHPDIQLSPASVMVPYHLARVNKEQFYSGQTFNLSIAGYIFNDGNRQYTIIKSMDKAFMARMTEGTDVGITTDKGRQLVGSWMDLCRQFFDQVRNRIKKENLPIGNIVLTGGASRMPFISDLCREVFGDCIGDGQILRWDNPSDTVAYGLARIAELEELLSGCKEAAIKQVSEFLKESSIRKNDGTSEENPCYYKTLQQQISSSVYQTMCEQTQQVFDRWAEFSDDRGTLFYLQNMLNNHLKNHADEYLRAAEGPIDRWKASVRPKIAQAVKANMGPLFVDQEQLMDEMYLPEDVWQQLTSDIVVKMDNIPIAETIPKAVKAFGYFLSSAKLHQVLDKLVEKTIFIGAAAAVLEILQWIVDKIVKGLVHNAQFTDEQKKRKYPQEKREKYAKGLHYILDPNYNICFKKYLMEDVDSTINAETDYEKLIPAISDVIDKAFDIIVLKYFPEQKEADTIEER